MGVFFTFMSLYLTSSSLFFVFLIFLLYYSPKFLMTFLKLFKIKLKEKIGVSNMEEEKFAITRREALKLAGIGGTALLLGTDKIQADTINTSEDKYKALLIIDVQNDYFEGGKCELFEPLKALANIEKVLGKFREEKLPIINIQHINISPKATFFVPNTYGVEIHKNLTPKIGEFHITKNYPNSFLKTELLDILNKNNINELVVCGMMSHMCIDTTVRACMDYKIKVTLLEDTCTTKDLVFENKTILATTVHKTFMASLNGMFANVIKTDEFILER